MPPLAARGFGRLIGPLPQTLGLQERGCAPFTFAPCRLSPTRGVGRLIGPLAHTLGLQERGCAPFTFAPCRLSPTRGVGRLIGPLAHTLGLQERGCAPFTFAPCRLSPTRGVGRLIGPLAHTLGLQERGCAPFASCCLSPARGADGLLGLWPIRSAYRSADALPSPSPRAAFRRPRGGGRLIGPLAQTLGLQERGRAPSAFAPEPPLAARGSAPFCISYAKFQTKR